MPIFYKDHMNMSFHGNQIEDIVAILLLKTFHWHSKWNKMERFWRILSMTTRFYTKRYCKMKFTLFLIRWLISLQILVLEYQILIPWSTDARTDTCTDARMHACMHTHTHARTHACMHARTHIYIYIYIYIACPCTEHSSQHR